MRRSKDKAASAPPPLQVDPQGHVRLPVVLVIGAETYSSMMAHGIPQPGTLLTFTLHGVGQQWLVQLVKVTGEQTRLHILPANLAAGLIYARTLQKAADAELGARVDADALLVDASTPRVGLDP